MKPGHQVRGVEKRFDAATLRLLPEGVIRLEGRILSRNAGGELEHCLRRFHDQAMRHGGRRVVVDVVRLEWMSESAVTALVGWVLSIQREPADARYEVSFRINSALPWQHGTFRALVSVAPDVVSVEAV